MINAAHETLFLFISERVCKWLVSSLLKGNYAYTSVSSLLLSVWKYHYSDGWVEHKKSSIWVSTTAE
jgi:hypothetical protein